MTMPIKPAVRIRNVGTVSSRHEADALLSAPGDVVLVDRGRPRSLVISCPDGCGSVLTINLDKRAGPAWRLYSHKRGLTLSPSVWRDAGCEAHFILWHDRIVWCGRHIAGSEEPDWEVVSEAEVIASLTDRFRLADDIAEEIDAIPWEVSRVLDRLTRRGEIQSELGPTRRKSYRLPNAKR